MAEAATPVAKSQSWRPLLWGLAAFLVCPFLPFFEVLFPIQQTLLLLVPVTAACSIVGWKFGGRAALAVIWIAFSIWILLQPAGPPGTQYDQMARGWAILLAASFGLVSLRSLVAALSQSIRFGTSVKKSLLMLIGVSVLMWAMIAVAYKEVAHAYNTPKLEIPHTQIFLLMASSMVGSLVQLPGVGGGSQFATIETLNHIFGVPPELATSCGIMLWLVTFASLLAAALAVGASSAASVIERRTEIGLMKALGAGSATVGWLLAAEQLLLAFVGGCTGYAVGLVLARFLGTRIFGVPPEPSLLVLGVILVLAAAVTLLGSALPLRRAARFDPAPILRGE